MTSGPFRPGILATGVEFTDRADEVARIAGALATPGARLLVMGPRRMGKTSAIEAAARRVERKGVRVLSFDLSTATTATDAANRLMEAAARALGRRWKDSMQELIRRVGVRFTVAPDPSGLLLPVLDVSLRQAASGEQNEVLGRVLDGIDALAGERGAAVAVVIDEFQELSRIGGEAAEWHLRGRMQAHANVAYVLSGSETHLIDRMLEENRAFYRMLTPLPFGPMERAHMTRWIDARLEKSKIEVEGAGDRIWLLAAPRTQDVIRLARRTYELALTKGLAGTTDVDHAFESIIDEEAPLLLRLWEGLSALQQNVLRAVAGGTSGLTTGDTIGRFSLASTGSATNAARALLDSALLVREETPTGYAFDNPFMRGWVIREALPDIGVRLPPTHLPLPPLPTFRGAPELVDIADRDALYRAMEEEDD